LLPVLVPKLEASGRETLAHGERTLAARFGNGVVAVRCFPGTRGGQCASKIEPTARPSKEQSMTNPAPESSPLSAWWRQGVIFIVAGVVPLVLMTVLRVLGRRPAGGPAATSPYCGCAQGD
jgi:hypothetical protein